MPLPDRTPDLWAEYEEALSSAEAALRRGQLAEARSAIEAAGRRLLSPSEGGQRAAEGLSARPERRLRVPESPLKNRSLSADTGEGTVTGDTAAATAARDRIAALECRVEALMRACETARQETIVEIETARAHRKYRPPRGPTAGAWLSERV